MSRRAQGKAARLSLDQRLMLWLSGAVLLVIVLVSLFAPIAAGSDPRPSTYNAGRGGMKATYLMLQALGRRVQRWDAPLDALAGEEASQTTLVLADPLYTALEKDTLVAALRAFLQRGGRVLVTGGEGALLLPGGAVASSRRLTGLCYTEPAGPGALARAGNVEMQDAVRWDGDTANADVEQRCGPDGVVVRLRVGQGEAVWWSSASPMTNGELHNTADLKLLLASLGEGRRVLFDESLHQPVRSQWSAARGLPLWWMLGQSALVFGVMVFSFSRRRGPIRLPVSVPRSSPVEFAVSMGDLYQKAGATAAATEAARRRLVRTLVREAGLTPRTLLTGPEAVAEALGTRFGGDWRSVGEHLVEAASAADAHLKPGSALTLVKALAADRARVLAGIPAGKSIAGEPQLKEHRSSAETGDATPHV